MNAPATPHVVDVSTQSFDADVLQKSHELPVLVDFWAAWCGPCRMLTPALVRLAQTYGGKFLLAKVDTDAEQGLAARYGIRGLPTVKVFRNDASQLLDESADRDVVRRLRWNGDQNGRTRGEQDRGGR